MRQETEGVTEALLESAKKEFLEYGFNKASLRRISANSGVSTNSIYTRFKDKQGLFSAIVKSSADELMDIYIKSIDEALSCENVSSASHAGDKGTNLVLQYIYENLDDFKLIFCRSQGTEYENYFDKLGEIEEGYYRNFAKRYAKDNKKIDDFFIHVYCRIGWQYIYELVSHEKSYEEAKKFMENVRIFHEAGWTAVLNYK